MSEQIIRELPLIRRYSRRNAAEDQEFAAFVKFGLSRPNAEIDAVVAATTDEVWAGIDCTACAHCCRTLQIVVDDRDVGRLAARLGLAPREFARRYVRSAPDGVRHFADSPCAFLEGDGRCGVYEDRPQACRDFPYLHAAGFRKRALLMAENAAMCPIVFNVWQRLKRRFRAAVAPTGGHARRR